jgi:hypothetical protein
MKNYFLTVGVLLAGASIGTACNRSRNESHDRPGAVPQTEQSPGQDARLVQPPGPAGDPKQVIAPPRPESQSPDQNEGAGIAAGHTKKNQKVDSD